jgi:hypothetical protein
MLGTARPAVWSEYGKCARRRESERRQLVEERSRNRRERRGNRRWRPGSAEEHVDQRSVWCGVDDP